MVRGKALWKVSDNFKVTIAGDYTYQNQPSYPTTVLDVTTPAGDGLPTVFSAWPPGPYGFMGAQYNFCISTPAALLNDPAAFSAATGAPPFFSTAVGGLCGPRAQGLNLATGGAPLGGAGYVGGPVPYTPGGVAGNPSGPSAAHLLEPREHGHRRHRQDLRHRTELRALHRVGRRRSRSIGTCRIRWRSSRSPPRAASTGRWVSTSMVCPRSIQEVTDHQKQDQFSQEFQLTGQAMGDKLDYVVGLYYFQEDGFVHDFVPFGSTLFIYDVAERCRHQVVRGVLPRRLQLQ